MLETSTRIQTYSAEHASRGTLAALPLVLGYPTVIWRNRGLVWNFFRRELLGRFRGSMLGLLWVLVQPLFLFAVYFLVFGILLGPKTGGGANPDFAVYLFAGIIGWSWFLEATTRSTTVVIENGNLVKKVAFPCELLPLPLTMVAGLVYLVAAAILLVIGLPLGWIDPDWRFFCWPLVIAVQTVFTLGFSLILANLYVFVRDMNHLYGIVSMAWFFMSPIFFYPETLLNVKALPVSVAHAFTWNPIWPLVMLHRHVFGVPGTVDSFWSDLGMASVWALVFMVIGHATFVARKNRYADLV